MKKLLACLFALMLFVPTALAAPAYEDALPGYYKPPKANEGQYPIKEEGVSLTYWMPIHAVASQHLPSYDDNPAYAQAQKDTGVDIQFIHPAAGTEKESFQLSVTGELPDMYLLPNGSYYTGDLQAMYDEGLIIDLTPYMEENAPQYMEIINSNELGSGSVLFRWQDPGHVQDYLCAQDSLYPREHQCGLAGRSRNDGRT